VSVLSPVGNEPLSRLSERSMYTSALFSSIEGGMSPRHSHPRRARTCSLARGAKLGSLSFFSLAANPIRTPSRLFQRDWAGSERAVPAE